MQHYHLYKMRFSVTVAIANLSLIRGARMYRVIKPALLSLAIVAGSWVAAQAQSVSALPPSGGTGQAQSAITQPYGSSQSYFPKPGGSQTIKQEAASPQPAVAVDRSDAPYSSKFGPKPN